MAEQQKSMLYRLKPIYSRLPTVKKPDTHINLRTKLLWTGLILIIYFVMTNIFIYGLDVEGSIDIFSQYRAIMASATGTLMHLGIGPIVTGSIIMQLFTGARIINLDLSKPDDREVYHGSQKVVAISMILIESIPQVFGYLQPAGFFVTMLGGGEGGLLNARLLIIAQLFVGGYLVLLMDEVVSKWGIGSGISLFIAAGVSQAIMNGALNWIPLPDSPTPPGTIPRLIYLIQNSTLSDIVHGGGYEDILLGGHPNSLIALLGTVAVFFIVVYAEGSRIELPLAHAGHRGARGRYPIRLIYASNIPVILMAALLANVNLIGILLWNSDMPFIGGQAWIGDFGSGTQALTGIAYYLSPINGVYDWLLPLLDPIRYGGFVPGRETWQIGAHIVIYFTAMILGSIVFARFWIETTNMGPKAVAKQIQSSGMQIPGFRRDARIMENILERYIPAVTVISGAFVGALAAGADMIGTLGAASGTGVLLTVGILYRLYEQLAKEQAMEMHPILRNFLGEQI